MIPLELQGAAAGQAASQAKREGADTDAAIAYGITMGTAYYLAESISGGVLVLGKGAVSESMKKLLTSPAAGTLIDILDEGGESALTTYLTPYFKRAFYDKDAKNATPGEIAGNAAASITASLLLHGAAALPSYVEDDFASNQTVQKRLADSGKDEYDLNSDLVPGLPEDDFEDFNSDLRGYAEGSGTAIKHPDANRAITEGAGELWESTDNLIKSATTPGKGGVSPVGRAFQKHAGNPSRAGTFVGEVSGNATRNTEQGAQYISDILSNPQSTYKVRYTDAFGDILDVRLPDGTGARWSVDGKTFIGFLEKYTK